MCKSGDIVMPESGDAMSYRGRLRTLLSSTSMFESLGGKLVCRQVVLFSMLFAHPMGMPGAILEFSGPLVILVLRSVVSACGH